MWIFAILISKNFLDMCSRFLSMCVMVLKRRKKSDLQITIIACLLIHSMNTLNRYFHNVNLRDIKSEQNKDLLL